MNLTEFKEREKEIVAKIQQLGGDYQFFSKSKGIARGVITLFENELLKSEKPVYLFFEVHGVVYYSIVDNPNWSPIKTGHKNRSLKIDINFSLTALSLAKDTVVIKPKVVKEDIRPQYYEPDSPVEPKKIIDHYELSWFLGNVIKYVLRAGKKSPDTYIQDLQKAITNIRFQIESYERKQSKLKK